MLLTWIQSDPFLTCGYVVEKVKIWQERGYVIKEIWTALKEIMNILVNTPEEAPMETSDNSLTDALTHEVHYIYDINGPTGTTR